MWDRHAGGQPVTIATVTEAQDRTGDVLYSPRLAGGTLYWIRYNLRTSRSVLWSENLRTGVPASRSAGEARSLEAVGSGVVLDSYFGGYLASGTVRVPAAVTALASDGSGYVSDGARLYWVRGTALYSWSPGERVARQVATVPAGSRPTTGPFTILPTSGRLYDTRTGVTVRLATGKNLAFGTYDAVFVTIGK